jgi:hypothetical protein
MNGDSPGQESSLPLDALARIDQVCLRFEAAWKSGERAQIEDFLGDSQEAERSNLLRELLLLELYYRRQNGEKPTPMEYNRRFAGHAELINAVFREARGSSRAVQHDEGSTQILLKVTEGPHHGQTYSFSKHEIRVRLLKQFACCPG